MAALSGYHMGLSKRLKLFEYAAKHFYRDKNPRCLILKTRTASSHSNGNSKPEVSEETYKKLIIQDENRLPAVTPLKRIGRNIAEHALLAAQVPDQPPEPKFLTVAILGRPNVGKSLLVNRLMNWKVCSVAEKINSTKRNTSAILTKDDTQLIFIDTPGVKDVSLFQSRKKTGKKRSLSKIPTSLVCDPQSALFNADLIMVMVDVTDKSFRNRIEPPILHALCLHQEKPAILVLNKIDEIKSRPFLLQLARMLTDGFVGGTRTHDKPVRDQASKYFKKINPDALMNEVEDILDKKEESKDEGRPDVTGFPVFSDGKVLGRKEGKKVSRGEAMNKLFDKVADILRDENIIKDRVAPYSSEQNDHGIVETIDGKICEKCNPSNAEGATSIDEGDKTEMQKGLKTGDKQCNQSDVADGCTKTPETTSNSLVPLVEVEGKLTEIKKEAALMLSDKKWLEYFKYLRKVAGIFVKDKVGWPHFDHVFYVSAKHNEGVEVLKDYLLAQAVPGDWQYHSSFVTETEPNVLVEQFIMEKCLDFLPQEIPYKLEVSNIAVDVRDDDQLDVSATIYSFTKSHYIIVHSKKDTIAQAAKQEIMNAFRSEVKLCLTVRQAETKKGKQKRSLSQEILSV